MEPFQEQFPCPPALIPTVDAGRPTSARDLGIKNMTGGQRPGGKEHEVNKKS